MRQGLNAISATARGEAGRRSASTGAIGACLSLLVAVSWGFLPDCLGGHGSEVDKAYIPAAGTHWDNRLVEAQRSLAEGEYQYAIEILQNAVELGGDSLTLVDDRHQGNPQSEAGEAREEIGETGDEGGRRPLKGAIQRNPPSGRGFKPRVYISVADRARQELVDMPPAARQIYRRTYETMAQETLEEAVGSQRTDLLQRVAMDYFPTAAGTRARVLLASRYFDRGRVRRALRLWQSALMGVLESRGLKTAVQMRILLSWRLLGERDAYDRLRAQLLLKDVEQAKSGGDGGADGGVTNIASQVSRLESSLPMTVRSRSAVVPLAGWAADGRVVGEDLPPLAGADGYRLEWASPWWSKKGIAKHPFLQTTRRGTRLRSYPLPVSGHLPYSFYPAFSNDNVFVSSVDALWKMDLETGNLVQQIKKPFFPQEAFGFRESSESPIYCPVIEDNQIFSHTISGFVRREHYMGYMIYEEIPTRTLVARDLMTGKLLWHTRDFTLGTTDDPMPVSFVTPPLILEDKVIVGGWINTGHVNCIVAAFSRQSGRPLWNTLLASNQLELTMFGEWAREPLGWVIAEDEGILHCVPGVGVVAEVDSENGRILRLSTYEPIPIRPSMTPHPQKRNLLWQVNPPLLVDGVLYATPRDSSYLHAFQTNLSAEPLTVGSSQEPPTGPILWRRPNREGLTQLLGFHDGHLYLSGPRDILALKINRDDVRQIPEVTASWKVTLDKPTVFGRPAMSDRGIVFSHNNGLSLLDYDLTLATDLSEPFEPSEHGRYPGNVVLWRNRIIVISRDILASYVPKEKSTTQAEKRAATLVDSCHQNDRQLVVKH